MAQLEWTSLRPEDLPGVTELARACLARDGGLPQLTEPDTLRRLFFSPVSIAGRDDTGDIVAVAGLTRDEKGEWIGSGLVHPAARHQGHGEALARWGRQRIGSEPVSIVLESVPPEVPEIFAAAGFVEVFAEYVQVHRGEVPKIKRPEGLRAHRFDAEYAAAFHEAYRRSFAERPGFPDTPREEWVRWVENDPAFRPALSRVVLEGDVPVGFVTVSDGWIDQVGVVPEWRGRGLGAHLVVRSVRALRKAGFRRVHLCVNVDNPAADLYRRLGFVDRGRRARYRSAEALEAGATAH